MKNTFTIDLPITLRWTEANPHVLDIDDPLDSLYGIHEAEGGQLYLSETDGTSATCLLEPVAHTLLGKDHPAPVVNASTHGNGSAWIEHWNTEALATLNGRTVTIRYTCVEDLDDDGEVAEMEETFALLTQAPGTTLAERHQNWQPMAAACASVVDRYCHHYTGTTGTHRAAIASEHGVHNSNRYLVTDENKHEFDLTSLISNFDRPTPEELELRYTTPLAETLERNRNEILREQILEESYQRDDLTLWIE